MAGDKVQINTFAFYNTTTQPPVTDNTLLNDLLLTLVSGVTAQSGGKIGSGNSTQLSNTVSPNILSFLNSRTYNSSLPKAYLNWVLLDDQFKYVAGNMGAMQVQAGSSKQALVAPLQTIAKNGYLYIYVSNQSPQNVYFDDLVIKHYTGPLLQEQSYYPFGLKMAGISDQAMGKLDSKNKFNGGVEIEEDYGVNLYATFYREYDPQLGRFNGVDCQSEASMGMSVYQFGANNPISLNDPLGNRQTAGLYGGRNGYYNFPENHHHESADPLAGTFMDPGGDGGGGGGGYGGGGYGDYSAFWNNLWQSVPKGKDITFTNDPTFYDASRPYGYANLTGAYNTGGYHGDVYDDLEIGQTFMLTTFKGLDLSPGMFSWDGSIMRSITPDFVSVGVGFNGIAGVGGGSSIEFQWVLHGPEASWSPALTATQSIGAGYSVDATINIGSTRYSGRALDIKRKMLFTNSLSNGDAPTIWGSGGAEILGKVGLTGTFTPLDDGYIYGSQANFGLGLIGPNFAGGISNTWLLNDWAE